MIGVNVSVQGTGNGSITDLDGKFAIPNVKEKDVLFVSESAIKTREDTRQLAAYHVNAVLIGETLMRSPDKKAALESLNGSPLK